jgi:hypothetical protein
MRPSLDDPPRLEDKNAIRIPHCAQPVRNRNSSSLPACTGSAQRNLHDPLTLRIQRTRRFIKKQDLRIPDQRSRNRHALPLPAG